MFLRSWVRSLIRRWGIVLGVAATVTVAGVLLWPSSPFVFRAEARLHLPADAAGAEEFLLSDVVLEHALRTSRDRSSFDLRRQGDLLTLSASAGSPSRAVERANAVAAAFQALWPRPRDERTRTALNALDREIGERRRALAELERALLPAGPADPLEETRRAHAAALLESQLLAARLGLLTKKLEAGEAGPARPIDTAASDRAGAQAEAARRRLEGLRAIYPEDWPPVAAAAAEVERLRVAHAETLNREALEARFAPVRSLVEEIRDVSRRREAARLAVAQHEALLEGTAPAPEAAPGLRRRVEESSASLRDLVAQRDRIALASRIAPRAVERIDPAAGAKLVSAPFFLVAGAGLVAGLLAAAVAEALVTTLRIERDVRRTVNLPILGVVPKNPSGAVDEVYGTMAAVLEGSSPSGQGHVFGLASAVAGEGKSTVAAGLAAAFARASVRVLLVDADLRRPAQHARFGVANESGLSSYLTGAIDTVESAIVPTETENLSLLPSGPPMEAPVPYLRSERFTALIAALRGRYDVVILDLPPVCRTPDALLAAPLADGMILVVAAGETRKDDVTQAKRLVRSVGGKWTGCVLNKAAGRPLGYYYYGPAASADAGA